MSKTPFIITIIALLLSFASCSQQQAPQPDIQMASSDIRYPAPDGKVQDDEIVSSMRIDLINDYPVWSADIQDASVRIVFHNTSKRHLATQSKALLYIYNTQNEVPLYWTVLDLAFGKTATPGTLSVVSLPVGATKEIAVPLLDTKWADVSIKTIPALPFYQLVSEGQYLMRFEMELYNDEDKPIDTVVSNFIEFERK